MSARDLARFALLYLNGGKWRDRQIVPARWVDESTRAYSQSGFGPGYGYLWWTGFADDTVNPVVKLPPGTFFAWGAGGQFAFVVPAHDLVLVNRAPHAPGGGPRLFEMSRLLQLVFAAGGSTDTGK
jgi:CubicO group peptidase (beta-lactamase class C family)